MIDRLPQNASIYGLITALITAFIMAIGFLAKQILTDPNKKAEEDKALLKELLEGFGLELPPELKEQEAKVMNSINTQ